LRSDIESLAKKKFGEQGYSNAMEMKELKQKRQVCETMKIKRAFKRNTKRIAI
jgi:hypothetical protein